MGHEDIVETLGNRCKSVIDSILSDPSLDDVASASAAVMRKFRAVGAQVLQAKMDAAAERRREVAAPQCCAGAAQHLVHTRAIRATSLFGPVRLRLRTYRCSDCGAHQRPDDAALGAPSSGRFTDDVRDLLAPLSAELPDRVAADLLERTTGLHVSPRGVQSVIRTGSSSRRRRCSTRSNWMAWGSTAA
ncbi:MAG: hypothetical protein GY733_01545 [bacterium]|nr:hypothetical protein [bacterium]